MNVADDYTGDYLFFALRRKLNGEQNEIIDWVKTSSTTSSAKNQEYLLLIKREMLNG